MKMGRDEYCTDTEVDEYLWPLTGDVSSIRWESVTEELHIRQRLAEIMAHVNEMHVRPRLRQMAGRAAASHHRSIAESIIGGPPDGPPWAQTLKESVPRALREEWNRLAQRLRELNTSRSYPRTTELS